MLEADSAASTGPHHRTTSMTSPGPFNANSRPHRSHAAKQTSHAAQEAGQRIFMKSDDIGFLRSHGCTPTKDISNMLVLWKGRKTLKSYRLRPIQTVF